MKMREVEIRPSQLDFGIHHRISLQLVREYIGRLVLRPTCVHAAFFWSPLLTGESCCVAQGGGRW
jgi:hypothetical protein